MHPIERLRFVARAGAGHPVELACEAAGALGDLAQDRRALLVACRRLLANHPECGPLWWLCARLLVASNPLSAAGEAQQTLLEDKTSAELAAALPSGAVVVSTASPTTVEGLALRPDLEVRLVGRPPELAAGVRMLDGEVAGYGLAEAADALENATVVLVEALAAAPAGLLAAPGSGELARLADAAGPPCWVVVPAGRILPPVLFTCAAERALDTGSADLLAVELLTAVIGPEGLSAPAALQLPECPSVHELTGVAR